MQLTAQLQIEETFAFLVGITSDYVVCQIGQKFSRNRMIDGLIHYNLAFHSFPPDNSLSDPIHTTQTTAAGAAAVRLQSNSH